MRERPGVDAIIFVGIVSHLSQEACKRGPKLEMRGSACGLQLMLHARVLLSIQVPSKPTRRREGGE